MATNKLLIVDDVEMNRELLGDMFENKYDIFEAEDGIKALELLAENEDEIACILLDIVMPNMDGMQVLKNLKDRNLLARIPVLMISADNSSESELECLNMGAFDFISKPFKRTLVKSRVDNAINLYMYKNHLEEKVKEQTERIRKTNYQIVNILGNLVESRNLESGEHVQRVSQYTAKLGTILMQRHPEYGLTPERIELISEAAALHDIGKIAISDAILLKPGRLEKDEFEIMKTHTTLGADYLRKVEGIWDKEFADTCYDIAKHHHEKYDGSGYPDGLVGDDIPWAAQLVSVADVYDALIEERCYKKAFSKSVAKNMILGGECGAFSPDLMECFEVGFPFED